MGEKITDSGTGDVLEILKARGIKVTPQRLTVAKYLLFTKDHPTAEMIQKKAVIECPTVGTATVYKTLKLFKEKGLIQELEINGVTRYDPNLNPHVHFICIKCGKIDDYFGEEVNEFINKVSEKTGRIPRWVGIEFYYICGKCAENRN